MPKNQLFKIIPEKKFILELLKLYGIENLEDTRFFTKDNLDSLNTLENIINIIDELNIYYLPCKSKVYLKDITLKRCIVILRQFIKILNYTLFSKEKFIKGKKTTIYQIIPLNDGINITKPLDKKITISFE
jgi:hypothetical protein